MYDRAQELDLRKHLRLGIEHLFNTLDERNHYLPFFHYELLQVPICVKHGPFDSPHVVGRYLDALGMCAPIVELPDRSEAIDALAQHLYDSLSHHASGLPWNTPTPWQPSGAVMHNCREALLGLIALTVWREDPLAKPAARRLIRSITDAIGESARFPGDFLGETGWATAFDGILSSPPATTGRLIRPLLHWHRLTGDGDALHLARRLAADNYASAFTEDGQITQAAGSHVHSIAGTVTGLIDYGLLVGEQDYVETGRRVFDAGFSGLRTSYGWVKEFRFAPHLAEPLRRASYPGYDILRGEANNTADLIEAAILLGRSGYATYYEDADRYLRNHLLALQLVDTSWVEESHEIENTERAIYGDVARRARGGFCFGSPSDIVSYPEEPYQTNADLAGGSLQAICEAWNAISTAQGDSLRVDLHFSKTDQTMELTCPPPGTEPIVVRPLVATNLQIRIPSWAHPGEVRFQVGAGALHTGQGSMKGSYLNLQNLDLGSVVQVWLPDRRDTTVEIAGEQVFEVDWHNDTVIGIRPPASIHPLYPSLASFHVARSSHGT